MTLIHSGEVTCMSDYERALEGDIKLAADEVDDAQQGLQRAEQDVARYDATDAALRSMKVDRQTLDDLATMREFAEACRADLQKLLQDAEGKHASATTALDGLRARHQAIQERADVVADRAFYAGD